MRLSPHLDRRFWLVFAGLWALCAWPAYFALSEMTSTRAGAMGDAKRVTATITREIRTRGSGHKLDVRIPRTYGISTCIVYATDAELDAVRSREIPVYVVPDATVVCATPSRMPGYAARGPASDVVAAAMISAATASAITWLFLVRLRLGRWR